VLYQCQNRNGLFLFERHGSKRFFLNQAFRNLRVKNMDFKKMGVNENISILMLFDCVRVNTGLDFH
jgi:hypothetical protein